uniref:Uncharacterized protein n=1 Tax=Candidatus Kentrum sp. FM TaxID=2126340 RepID=A0A450TYZ8_9GAMM|nr:MAG: hypothetical protein BECKFM1743A_GA0114220_108091 [Candidatus Kentron sp. FM]VFK21733.1 MAG: hypothetical protein BECKFM1743B_GA0114221_108091 [Candidatus Kentron sp. FM]
MSRAGTYHYPLFLLQQSVFLILVAARLRCVLCGEKSFFSFRDFRGHFFLIILRGSYLWLRLHRAMPFVDKMAWIFLSSPEWRIRPTMSPRILENIASYPRFPSLRTPKSDSLLAPRQTILQRPDKSLILLFQADADPQVVRQTVITHRPDDDPFVEQ